MKTVTAVTLVAALMLAAVPAVDGGSPRTERSLYAGPGYFLTLDHFNPHYFHPALWGHCSHTTPVGGACFKLDGSESFVDLSMSLLGPPLPAAGLYVFYDRDFAQLGYGELCGAVNNVAVPHGAIQMSVFALDPATASIFCTWIVPTPSGTVGEIVATFR